MDSFLPDNRLLVSAVLKIERCKPRFPTPPRPHKTQADNVAGLDLTVRQPSEESDS